MLEKHEKLLRYDPAIFRNRFRFLFWVVMLAASLLVVRLWYLQVINGGELRQRSENNRIRIREVKALRGIILDSRGNVLADNRPSFDVTVFPEDVKDVKGMIQRLESLYNRQGLVFSENYAAALEGRRAFIPLRLDRNISHEKLAIVETHSLELPGVGIDVMPVREYYYGEMMAHVLGYVSEVSRDELERDTSNAYKVGDIIGKFGIEKSLDYYLRGKNGGEQVEVNAIGKKIRTLGLVEPVSGYRVILTLDAQLQRAAWNAMEGKAGSAIAMDPRDGSILAMVSRPAFDPNLFNRGITFENWEKLVSDPLRPLDNKSIAGQYPPGSTYKLIVAAAALEEGLITPETTFACNGTFDLGNRTFRCWRKEGHGRISLHRAIVESCDVYFYNVGRLVGVDRLAQYAESFGLGIKTGVSLTGEKKGLIPTKEWKQNRFGIPWQPGETISLSIGQGYNSVTPLQLLNAYCALANNGVNFVPRLVKRIEAEDGRIIEEFQPEKKSLLPVSQENIDLLKAAFWGVVNEPGGTGHAAMKPGADVAGKTGTAQVIGMPEENSRKGQAYEFQDHALFVCFAPREHPEIAVVVIVEHGGHGGSAAAPVARKILDAYFDNRKPA